MKKNLIGLALTIVLSAFSLGLQQAQAAEKPPKSVQDSEDNRGAVLGPSTKAERAAALAGKELGKSAVDFFNKANAAKWDRKDLGGTVRSQAGAAAAAAKFLYSAGKFAYKQYQAGKAKKSGGKR